MRSEGVLDAIGNTPLVRLRVPAAGGVRAYAKLEMQELFAMKDRVARQVVLAARESGELAPGAPIVESSSGTMALGLALVGTALGHPVHIVTDPRIDPVTLAKLEALGCAVHVVPAMTGQGWQSARLEELARLLATLPGAYWPRQYANPQNPAAYAGLAAELRTDLGEFDVLVGAVGSGGSLCGTARALRPDLPGLRVVGVDAVGSMLFGQPDRPRRRQSGLGNSLQPENLDHALIDEVHWLSDDEAFAATRDLAREQQLFAGNTAGSVYRVLRHLAGRAAPGTTLVGIFPDRGDRYVESVYRAAPGPVRAEPVEVAYGTPVTSWSYAVPARPPLVFVESNTTGTGMLALRTAARLGTAPVLLANRPSRYAGLDRIRARVVECDTNDEAALVAVVAGLGPLAGVTTTSEFYTAAAAGLATAHGRPANPVTALRTCRDKSRTRAALDAAGIRQPRWVAVRQVSGAADAAAAVGLPCVVKPADDSGSQHVQLCVDMPTVADQVRTVLAVRTNARGQATAGTALVEAVRSRPGGQRRAVRHRRRAGPGRGDREGRHRAAALRRERPRLPGRPRARGGGRGGAGRPGGHRDAARADPHRGQGHRRRPVDRGDQRPGRGWHDPRAGPAGHRRGPAGAAVAGSGRAAAGPRADPGAGGRDPVPARPRGRPARRRRAASRTRGRCPAWTGSR